MTDYTELIRSLRNCSNNRCTPSDCGWFNKYQVDESCKEIIMWKAADAIETLQAELAGSKDAIRILKHNLEMKKPKRGEWVEGDARSVTARCSVCGHLRLGNGAEWANKHVHFCEVCGSRMGGEKE